MHAVVWTHAVTLLPPVGLVTSSLVGNVVTLRWSIPSGGIAPTAFVLEGGVQPGEVSQVCRPEA